METILLTVLVIAAAMGAMGLGVIFSQRPLKGSCGGTGQACACSRLERMRCSARPSDNDA